MKRAKSLRRSISLRVYEEVSMAGKTVAITNANCGLGFQVARMMALRDSRLILISSTKESALKTKERILKDKAFPVQEIERAIIIAS
ncbi:unnamed protein product [Soboliphyme baturini]|uniref:SDR family NAD(P)-dependent oxidoreductase n=1 Tax=Soboliphyme baturini TaxID=241478 RepID=A0A183ICX1_9BILA|nr:unnamed protein product [Soboliphyme baturini]